MTELLRAVLGQHDVHWDQFVRPKLDGLTDDELHWEPVTGCWGMRRRDDGLVDHDFAWPPPDPSPFTTIAWRLFHVSAGCFAERATRYFADHVRVPWTQRIWEGPFAYPLDAAAVLAELDTRRAEWRAGVLAGGDDGLWRPLGDGEGDAHWMQLGRDDPFLGLVLHVHREAIHHLAEVLTVRDLYRARH